MGDKYILVGKEPKKVETVTEWATQFESMNRVVSFTKIGDVDISTVFLGLDHNYGGGEPLIFETMVFGGEHDGYQDRYSTWDEAEEGHKAICEKLKNNTLDV